MKKFLKQSLFALILGAMCVFSFQFSALAEGNPENGAKIFAANCAACHAGGGNVVMGNKTLKKDALAQYNMASLDAITNQVMKGKNAMPKFLGRLNAQQIEDVATYVLAQSEKGW